MPKRRRIQVLLDPELDEWLASRARTIGASKSAIVREVLSGHKAETDHSSARRVDEFLDYLRAEVWRHVPDDVRGTRMTKEQREELLGIGPEGY
jgi:negative regulator of replication initiation